MKKASFFCFLVLVLSALFVNGQKNATVTINPEDPAFRQKFSELSFDGKFYILAVRDQTNNYYMADFKQLQSRFEKVWFMNLAYGSDKVISIDSDITQPRPWFLVNNKYSDKEAGAAFEDLKEKTIKASSSMSEQEKSDWLIKNDKFKK